MRVRLWVDIYWKSFWGGAMPWVSVQSPIFLVPDALAVSDAPSPVHEKLAVRVPVSGMREIMLFIGKPMGRSIMISNVLNALLLIGGSSLWVNTIIVCSVVKASIDGGRSMIGQLPMTSCVRLVSTPIDSGILEIAHIIMCSVWRFAITSWYCDLHWHSCHVWEKSLANMHTCK